MVIVAGRHAQKRAVSWLRQHHAIIDHSLGLTIITLPKSAIVEKGNHDWMHTVSFYGPDDILESSYVEVQTDVDANETVLSLRVEN